MEALVELRYNARTIRKRKTEASPPWSFKSNLQGLRVKAVILLEMELFYQDEEPWGFTEYKKKGMNAEEVGAGVEAYWREVTAGCLPTEAAMTAFWS